MKFTLTAAVFSLLAGLSVGGSPSPRFYLVAIQQGQPAQMLAACNIADRAAALCPTPPKTITNQDRPYLFKHMPLPNCPNSTVSGWSAEGVLSYDFPVTDHSTSLLPLSFELHATNNIAEPYFSSVHGWGPGIGQPITFASNGKMGVVSRLNSKGAPCTPRVLSNWYFCDTTYQLSQRRTLAWMAGDGTNKPENPSCVKYDIYRLGNY